MKIAYIVEPRRVIGGGVRAAINLAKGMKAYYGHEAVVFGTLRGAVSDEECRFSEVDTLRPLSLRYWRTYSRFIRQFQPDVVHCLGLFTALFCLIHRGLSGKRYRIVCTVHRVTMQMRFRRLIGLVIGFIARGIDYATFLTPYQQRHYEEKVHFRPRRYVIVPNVIYVQMVAEEERIALRNQLKTELKADYLTSYVGRIIPSKNLEDFIRVIALANRRGLNIGGVLVGGCADDYKQKLQAVIEEERIGEKIKFTGFTNSPTLFTGAADFTTTTTTHGEALPNLMVESMALGRATFSSDIPQMTALISHGTDGFTLPLTNLDAWAEGMEQFCTDPALRQRIEQAARRTYEATYEPQAVAEQYNQVYLSCLR